MNRNSKFITHNSPKTPFWALAPMANITTYPFASQCVKYGADLVWTPMVHTDTVINNWEEAEKILNFECPACHSAKPQDCHPEQSEGAKDSSAKPQNDVKSKGVTNYVIQLVGSDPSKFAEAIKIIQKRGLKPVGFDINTGCPDKNILKSGCGGSLLQNPDLIIDIAKNAISVSRVPVSVKTRAGYDNLTDIFDLAPKLIDAGISMLTIHPRTVRQGYTGSADWNVVKEVKRKVKSENCLILGSGDVKTWQEAVARAKETGCDGVMIGRGALGNPWIFQEIKEGRDLEVREEEIKNLALDLAQKSDTIWGNRGILEARKHFAWYFKGFDGAKELRSKLMSAESLQDVRLVLDK